MKLSMRRINKTTQLIKKITPLEFKRKLNCSAAMFQHNLTKPPESVRGMTILDKTKFESTMSLSVLNITEKQVSEVIPRMKRYLFKMRQLKPCFSDDGTNFSLLLNPVFVKIWSDIHQNDRDILEKLNVTSTHLSTKEIVIKYENYHANEVLRAILPEDKEGFSSFSQIGHIVHVNLREHLLPFKKVIGQVLLDKIPNTRTVINKLDIIDNTYRYFEKELLCGEDDMMVNVKENRCEFEFDFSKIYWNPRLSTEHERIVSILRPNDVLFDVFAGVGPFSIPAAKKQCMVFANDLNPESYKWLNHNLTKNKVDTSFLKTFNKDGRDFIVSDLKTNLINYLNIHNVHIVMNLPASAVEFLSAFVGLYKAEELDEIKNEPIVHVYCFAKGENYMEIARNLVFKNIGFEIADKITNVTKVRTVSSLKEMMRVSFRLDKGILVDVNKNKRKHDGCIAETEISTNKKCLLQ